MKIRIFFSYLVLIVVVMACSSQEKEVAPDPKRKKDSQINSAKGNSAVIQGDWELTDIDFQPIMQLYQPKHAPVWNKEWKRNWK